MAASKKLTKKEIRERQRQAGLARVGPRRKPRKGERVTPDGYVIPGRYKGTRNIERNRVIKTLMENGASAEDLGYDFDLSPKTIEHIYRYFVEDE